MRLRRPHLARAHRVSRARSLCCSPAPRSAAQAFLATHARWQGYFSVLGESPSAVNIGALECIAASATAAAACSSALRAFSISIRRESRSAESCNIRRQLLRGREGAAAAGFRMALRPSELVFRTPESRPGSAAETRDDRTALPICHQYTPGPKRRNRGNDGGVFAARLSSSPSEARRRPASRGSPAISGRKGQWVCLIARLAPAGRARPSPPPPEPRACAAAKRRVTSVFTQRPRAAKECARRARPVVDALTKPNAHSRAACADGVRRLAHATGAADRASGQAPRGRASTRVAAAGLDVVG